MISLDWGFSNVIANTQRTRISFAQILIFIALNNNDLLHEFIERDGERLISSKDISIWKCYNLIKRCLLLNGIKWIGF